MVRRHLLSILCLIVSPSAFATTPAPAGLAAFSPTSGQWILTGTESGSLEVSFSYGGSGFIPVYGDWDGDGVATVGAFDPRTATWYLRNTPGPGPAEVIFQFGPADSIPVVGDWDGNGTTTVGVFVPGSAQWYLRNSNTPGAADLAFQYGWPGVVPVAGDWNGDKIDTVGVYYPPTGQWALRNSPGGGAADLFFSYGYEGTQPIVGDWSGSGVDGIGIYDPSSGLFLLRNQASAGSADMQVGTRTGFIGGPVGTRVGNTLVTLPGSRGPGNPGYNPAVDGNPAAFGFNVILLLALEDSAHRTPLTTLTAGNTAIVWRPPF